MHQLMANTLDKAFAEIGSIQADARKKDSSTPIWPMIVLRSPKGWTGPKTGRWQADEAHGLAPGAALGFGTKPGHLKLLEKWMRAISGGLFMKRATSKLS